MEPLLGGARRAEADLSRIETILNTGPEERTEIINYIARLGQSSVYVRELIQVIPPHARHKIGNWRGTFTLGQRCAAIDALAVLGGAESIPVLLESLADSTYRVRQASEKALETVASRLDPTDSHTRAAVTALVGGLSSFSLGARKVVVRILSGMPPNLVLGLLLFEALIAEEWWARREATWVLGRLGDRRATMRLIATLKDESAAVRASAAWALGRLDAPVSIQPLIERLDDQDEAVRAAAVEALAAQIARLPDRDERFRPALDRLVDVLAVDNDPSVRTAVLEALAAIDAPEAKISLHNVLNGLKT
ncbi:MAG: HEAT repeat domain-containing protein [Anaerolineae bacterium]|nr:HEAT repeat domain-containing protein [Anaerolineae bacterium]